MQITAISDTHKRHHQLTDLITSKDHILVHAGDAAHAREHNDNEHEMIDFLDWFESLPAMWKIYVPGNHDVSVEAQRIDFSKWPSVKCLVNSSIIVDGVKFWGSPYTPAFGRNWAWNFKRSRMDMVWNMIPEDTDVLITHGPPKTILDLTTDRDNNDNLINVGCKCLLNKVLATPNIKAHIFGHVHDQSEATNNGIRVLNDKDSPIFVNATVVNLRREVVNGPIRFGIRGER